MQPKDLAMYLLVHQPPDSSEVSFDYCSNPPMTWPVKIKIIWLVKKFPPSIPISKNQIVYIMKFYITHSIVKEHKED